MGISQFFRRSRGVGWGLFTKAKLVGWTSMLGFGDQRKSGLKTFVLYYFRISEEGNATLVAWTALPKQLIRFFFANKVKDDSILILASTSPSPTLTAISSRTLILAAKGVSVVRTEAIKTARPKRRVPPSLTASHPPGI